MKKLVQILSILLISSLLLAACGGDDSEQAEEVESGEEEQTEDETSESVEQEETEENETEEETEVNEEESEGDLSSDGIRGDTEDQEDLSIGDTGKIDSELATYEITLENARLFDELEGQKSQFDKFLLVDITIKNTGEETQSTEDLLTGIEVTQDLEGSGYQIFHHSYDTTEEVKMELEPGEETFGQFVAETYQGENYYLRTRVGLAASGYSNQVTWVIPEEEAEQE